MGYLVQDIKLAIRLLIKNPGFATIAVLSLAIGIGANTAIFGVVNAVMLRSLPYKDPSRVVAVYATSEKGGQTLPWSYPKYEAVKRLTTPFEQLAAFSEQDFNLAAIGEPERAHVEFVSAEYFSLLGVDAAVGRTFSPEEDATPGSHAVAVLGYGLWQRKYGGSLEIIGQTINLNQIPFTIIGVLPEGFKGQSGGVDVWVPIMMASTLTFPTRLTSPGSQWHQVIGRLSPGVTRAQARTEMAIVAKQIVDSYPRTYGPPDSGFNVVPLSEAKVDPSISKSLLILFAAVGFVLLIACINLANLLLAKALARRREVAIRSALGATRGHLIRQFLTESVILSLLGGILGLLVAYWTIDILTAFQPASISNRPGFWARYIRMINFTTIGIDTPVFMFNLGLSFITGIIFGLMPAIQASRTDMYSSLKEGATGFKTGLHKLRRISVRNLMITAEIALAVILLIGAGLMIRSFARIQSTQIGFQPANVLSMNINLPRKEYKGEAATAFYQQLIGRIAALPGVQAASASSSTPLSSNKGETMMSLEQGTEEYTVGYHTVGPDFFDALGIPIFRGRGITEQDRTGAKRVAVINQAAAQQFWFDKDPIGQQILLQVGWQPADEKAEIVGVVGNVKYANVEESVSPDVYLSYLQYSEVSNVIVRAASDVNVTALVPTLRSEVQSLNPNLPIYNVKTMANRLADSTSRSRFITLVLSVFSAIALILAAIGVYGIIGYSVTERTHEIGIRIALGARSADIMKLVLGDGLILTIIGLGAGLLSAFILTRILSSFLYGVSPTDPVTFIMVSLLLTFVALMAIVVPAWRATQVDPLKAVKYE